MTVYLICFDTPYKHARHYLGFTPGPLEDRLALHRAGRGARLMAVVTAAGISWRVTRTWDGGRILERQLKNQRNSPKLCPSCTPGAGLGRRPGKQPQKSAQGGRTPPDRRSDHA